MEEITSLQKLIELSLRKFESLREVYDSDLNFIILKKDSEVYTFIYDNDNRGECMRVLKRYAKNPELNFTWYDVEVLIKKIKQESENSKIRKRFKIENL